MSQRRYTSKQRDQNEFDSSFGRPKAALWAVSEGDKAEVKTGTIKREEGMGGTEEDDDEGSDASPPPPPPPPLRVLVLMSDWITLPMGNVLTFLGSSSMKTAPGRTSLTNCFANRAECCDECAVPNKYTRRFVSR